MKVTCWLPTMKTVHFSGGVSELRHDSQFGYFSAFENSTNTASKSYYKKYCLRSVPCGSIGCSAVPKLKGYGSWFPVRAHNKVTGSIPGLDTQDPQSGHAQKVTS